MGGDGDRDDWSLKGKIKEERKTIIVGQIGLW